MRTEHQGRIVNDLRNQESIPIAMLAESTVFCAVMLCSNVFAINYPVNPCHKILEKFLIDSLNVFFNLGKFRVDPMCA